MTKPANKKAKTSELSRLHPTIPIAPHTTSEAISPVDVVLVPGRGSMGRGGGLGAFYWHIYLLDKRAGYVFINVIEDEVLGVHPAIQIHINQRDRGKKIGRLAYQLACEQSGYTDVYAHMRKSNTASRRAAEAAGFVCVQDKRISQRSMVWQSKLHKK